MYVAKSYIGRDYAPGEVLPDDLPEELIERWISADAICEVEGAEISPASETPPAEDGDGNPGGQGGDGDTENVEPEDAPDAEPEDEIDEDAEPEEIDVTAGLVAETAEEKPKRATRKNGGKKS